MSLPCLPSQELHLADKPLLRGAGAGGEAGAAPQAGTQGHIASKGGDSQEARSWHFRVKGPAWVGRGGREAGGRSPPLHGRVKVILSLKVIAQKHTVSFCSQKYLLTL